MGKGNSKRIAISKKIRFEVFKRDKFKCQYCGSSAPDVLLQVDHIIPVAKNGTNNLLNLITACFDCNNGKRDKLLNDHTVITKQKEQAEQLQERKEQFKMMLKWHKGLEELNDLALDELKKHWENLAKGFSITETGKRTLKKIIKDFNLNEVLEAMETAATHYLEWEGDIVTAESWEVAFSKIGGIIKTKRLTEINPDLKDFNYIRGIVRNRFDYYDPKLTIKWLEAARSWGASIEELKSIACSTRNWKTFSQDIDELILNYKKTDK